MTVPRTARERARAELTREIKDVARRQLAEVGAGELSLRAVARELGLASSALYRYFPSRDRLLTELIVDAYNAIGAPAEAADPGRGAARTRWLAVWRGTRAWAQAHPHEYALVYGTPVPGYQAPADTVVPAARVGRALLHVVPADGPPNAGWSGRAGWSARLRTQARDLAGALSTELPAETVAALALAWTQLVGAISFELFGQYANTFEPADALFDFTAERAADLVGL